MGAIGVVTCPVCGESFLCEDESVENRERLKSLTRAHLREHDLPEAKVGIYGVQMADEHARLGGEGYESGEAGEAPAAAGGSWLEREADGLEDDVGRLGGPATGQ